MPISGARSFWRSRRTKPPKGRTPEHIAAFKDISEFLTAEVAARRANPTDDLITHLAEAEIDGDRLSEREVVLTTATFVMAGVESLSSFMSVFALNLHDYPDARRRLVADPLADRAGDRRIAALQYVRPALQTRGHAQD